VITRAGAGPEDPWARSRVLEQQFAAELEAALVPQPWATDDVGRLLDRVTRPDRDEFDLSYLLTNLGAVDVGPVVTGLWFTTVQTGGVEAFVVSAATVAGALHLTVAWPEPLVDRVTGAALADALTDAVTRMAR
jgi:hypothetical protein